MPPGLAEVIKDEATSWEAVIHCKVARVRIRVEEAVPVARHHERTTGKQLAEGQQVCLSQVFRLNMGANDLDPYI